MLFPINVKFVFRPVLFSLALLLANHLGASNFTFNFKIIASNDPIGAFCPPGTDTIVIKDTFVLDVTYYPFVNGLPFNGLLLVEGGVLYWSNNVRFVLGEDACVRLKDGGHIYPDNSSGAECSGSKSLYFDPFKYATCTGSGGIGLHTFSEINLAGCANCCDSPLSVSENFNVLNPESVGVIPNPAAGDFIIKAKGQSRMKSIEILDISGQRCAKFIGLNADQFEVKCHDLAPGLYFARVVFEEGMIIKKVILH